MPTKTMSTKATPFSQTLASRIALLEPVEQASRRFVKASAEFYSASSELQAAVRAALAGGVRVVDLCRATGMSRARIYQIQKM